MRVPRGPEIQKSWNLKILVPHIIKPRFYQTKMKQNNSPELLNLLFNQIFHKKCPTNAKQSPNCFPIDPVFGAPTDPL